MDSSPVVLESFPGVETLEEGQQVILELPTEDGGTDTDSVLMQVARVNGNQIHFSAPGSVDSETLEKFAMVEGPDGKITLASVDEEGLISTATTRRDVENKPQTAPSAEGNSELESTDETPQEAVVSAAVAMKNAVAFEDIKLPDVTSLHDDGNTEQIVHISQQQKQSQDMPATNIRDVAADVKSEPQEEAASEKKNQTCYLCHTTVPVVSYLLRGKTSGTKCSLAHRLLDCVSPEKLSINTLDAVCANCQSLIDAADEYMFHYQQVSKELLALLSAPRWDSLGQKSFSSLEITHSQPHDTIVEQSIAGTQDTVAVPSDQTQAVEVEKGAAKQAQYQERPLLVPVGYRPRTRKPSPRGDGEDSADEDWTPALCSAAYRSSRGRRHKRRRIWSPESHTRGRGVSQASSAPGDGARPRGRPRKSGVVAVDGELSTPAVERKTIEYQDVSSLKDQVKDVKTKRFSMHCSAEPSKSALERIVHLDITTTDGGVAPLSSLLSQHHSQRSRQKLADDDTLLASDVMTSRVDDAGDQRFECRRCEVQFTDSMEMVKHLHLHAHKPWCKRCRTEFPDRTSLLEHRKDCRLKHKASLSGFCDLCQKEVPYRRYHMKIHQELVRRGELGKADPLPPEEEISEKTLRGIGKRSAGGVCSICGKYVPARLRKHEKSHNVTTTCPICKKVFTREDVVRGHISRVHLKERPHVCSQCGKTFVSSYSLQRHEMIHNNEFRFYCQECGEGFRQKTQLTHHMRIKHGVMDVVFEDIQVLPEEVVSDALPSSALPLDAQVIDSLDKSGYVIAAATAQHHQTQNAAQTVHIL